MADTINGTTGTPGRARSQRTKLSLGDLGEPALIKGQDEGVKSMVLGTLIGRATGFTERKSPKDGQIFEGLSGNFRSVPADPKREELESGVLFIPDAFHNIIADQLRPRKKTDTNPDGDPNACIEFIFEITVIRAKNPAGYSWDFRPLMGEVKNPLDELFGRLQEHQKAAIADQRKPAQVTDQTKTKK